MVWITFRQKYNQMYCIIWVTRGGLTANAKALDTNLNSYGN